MTVSGFYDNNQKDGRESPKDKENPAVGVLRYGKTDFPQ